MVELFEDKVKRQALRIMLNRKKEQNRQPTKLEVLEDKYEALNFDGSLYRGSVIANGLRQGWFSEEDVAAGFKDSRLLQKPSDLPAWKIVWSYAEVEEKDFNAALKRLLAQLEKRELVQTGEILHAVGVQLTLSKEEVIDTSLDAIVAQAKTYIDDLERMGRLPADELADHDTSSRAWDGLGYCEAGTPEFEEVYTYLRTAIARATEKALPSKAKELLKTLGREPAHFIAGLSIRNEYGIYARVALLQHIPTKDFVDTLLKLSVADQKAVMAALKERYSHGLLSNDLAPESLGPRPADRTTKSRKHAPGCHPLAHHSLHRVESRPVPQHVSLCVAHRPGTLRPQRNLSAAACNFE